jgi:hypothetical protein
MRYLHIDPTAKTVKPVFAISPHDAVKGLHSGNVDHGVVYQTTERGVGLFVYEYGLCEGNGPYFELYGNLYSGDAVLYGFDHAGETIDMREDEDFIIKPQWLADKVEVELAIAAGVVERPETRVNGAVIWSWS